MNQNHSQYALITGASSGLGRALAVECASRGFNVVLVSLPGEGLSQLANDIQRSHSVKASFYEMDISKEGIIHDFVSYICDSYQINILINNVGTGASTAFEFSADHIERMIDLNLRATSLFTCLLLPELKKRKASYIINISSIISQYPSPFKSIYPASKAFVYSFSRSLNQELKRSPVSVTVALPGPMITNGTMDKRYKKQSMFGRWAYTKPEKVAKTIIHNSLKKKKVVVPGLYNKACLILMRVLPFQIGLPILYNVYKREIEMPGEKPKSIHQVTS